MTEDAPRRPGELVVVTGMTGAGRSTAAKELEDLGYYVIDNLPPAYRLLTLHSNGAIDTGVHFLTAAESVA